MHAHTAHLWCNLTPIRHLALLLPTCRPPAAQLPGVEQLRAAAAGRCRQPPTAEELLAAAESAPGSCPPRGVRRGGSVTRSGGKCGDEDGGGAAAGSRGRSVSRGRSRGQSRGHSAAPSGVGAEGGVGVHGDHEGLLKGGLAADVQSGEVEAGVAKGRLREGAARAALRTAGGTEGAGPAVKLGREAAAGAEAGRAAAAGAAGAGAAGVGAAAAVSAGAGRDEAGIGAAVRRSSPPPPPPSRPCVPLMLNSSGASLARSRRSLYEALLTLETEGLSVTLPPTVTTATSVGGTDGGGAGRLGTTPGLQAGAGGGAAGGAAAGQQGSKVDSVEDAVSGKPPQQARSQAEAQARVQEPPQPQPCAKVEVEVVDRVMALADVALSPLACLCITPVSIGQVRLQVVLLGVTLSVTHLSGSRVGVLVPLWRQADGALVHIPPCICTSAPTPKVALH